MTESNSSLSILPLPQALVNHHGRGFNGLFGCMREWTTQNRIPPVLLITGASGVGKRSIGYFLSQWILCQNRLTQPKEEEPGPCRKCLQCQRAIKGSWVDFLEIHPHEEDRDTLKIDQFRELKSKVGFGAHEGDYRVILIPNADHMTVQAANSMLKLLEEPPAGWIFLMTASDASLLLPTLVSRCQTIRLKPIPNQILVELLATSDIAKDRIQICSDLAQGSWGSAWKLAQDESWDRRKSLFDFLTDPSGMISPILDWATHHAHEFGFLVDQMELITFDLIRWSLNPSLPWINQDGETALNSHSKNALRILGSIEKCQFFWLQRAERLAQIRQESSVPLNRKILAQDLLIPWFEITP